jgi:hypothetical protein
MSDVWWIAIMGFGGAAAAAVMVVVGYRALDPKHQAQLRWKYRWQVVQYFPNGATIVRCSHRRELFADWCSDWRDRILLFRDRHDRSYHDVRVTPPH